MKYSLSSKALQRQKQTQLAMIRLLKRRRGGFKPSGFEIGRVDVAIPDLDSSFHGYMIASIADIHLDEWFNARRFEEVINLINRQQPDLVAIIGDLFSYEVDGLSQQMATSLNKLQPKDASGPALDGYHCQTNSLAKIFHYRGDPLSEDMLLGLGGGSKRLLTVKCPKT
jgi:hypothetical protein